MQEYVYEEAKLSVIMPLFLFNPFFPTNADNFYKR